MPRYFSGKEIARILSNKYGFEEISISGSHLKMRKKKGEEILTVIIPLHKEVSIGTFRSILRQGNIEKEDFMQKSRE